MSDFRRFNLQFEEDGAERRERQLISRHKRVLDSHWRLITDLSICLTDEGPDVTDDWLRGLRQRVANALPVDRCPEWLLPFRDPTVTGGHP